VVDAQESAEPAKAEQLVAVEVMTD
jgi:hypothetical protein